ncbi:MAG TPA: 2-C-methyl-D-erythritol 4-phosphate cytidylyltransferase [bacterium]|nr:2-C-methyl-D-erythritol 4-phosphate cytidylyltransferase [bacterium]
MKTVPRTAAVVVAAGVGRRMRQDKVLLRLRDKPILLYSLHALADHPGIDRIVIVTRSEIMPQVQSELISLPAKHAQSSVIEGGQQRYDSVWNAIQHLQHNDPPDIVLIQDGARPFLSQKLISQSIEAASEFGAACVAIKAEDTLKRSLDECTIEETLDRSTVWRAQTPQTFRFSLLFECFERLRHEGLLTDVTDDASVLERCGHPVRIVQGDTRNIKITHPLDLAIAEALLNNDDTTQ